MTCASCNTALPTASVSVKERMFATMEPFEYFECTHCGCVQIAVYPDDPGKYYPEHYYSFGRESDKVSLKTKAKYFRDRYTYFHKGFAGWGITMFLPNHFLKTLRRIKSISLQSKIADIGCGYGEILRSMQKLGFSNLTGIDPYNKEDMDIGNGLHIYKKTLEQLEGGYDLLMMHHVLEHLPDQNKVFKQVHERLATKGYFLVRIPLSDSFARYKYQTNWVQWDAPRHFYLHTRRSVEILAENNGFVVEEVIYDSNGMQFWGSELYRLGLPLFDKKGMPTDPYKYFSRLKMLQFNRMANKLNRRHKGDQAIFLMRKKPLQFGEKKRSTALGFVVYGYDVGKDMDMARWQARLKAGQLLVVNNNSGDIVPGALQGSNEHFEFSAYQQLCEHLPGEGPFVIVNDTLFKNHWKQGWSRLCRLAIRRIPADAHGIWGDIRYDGNNIPERPDPYLASWIFVIPNRTSLKDFGETLSQICNTQLPEPSPEYTAFLHNWVNPEVWYRGWHGRQPPAAIQRKIRTVRLEHALSRQLVQNGLKIHSLGEFAPLFYRFLRIVDRLQTRIAKTGSN
jgi:SAM-dependent methyltransferase